MATREDLERKIDKLEVNMDRTDRIVNGTEAEDVMVDGGVLVPSVRKWQKELEEEYGVPAELVVRAEGAALEAEDYKQQAEDIVLVRDYAAGLTLRSYSNLVRDSNGEFWRVSGQVDLPYVTTGAGIPEGDALVPAGDAVLRQDLANPDKGAAMVARGVVAVDSIADLLALPEGQRKEGLRYLVKEYHAGSDIGGGEFYWDAGSTEDENGGTVFGDAAQGRWKRRYRGNVVNWTWFGAVPDYSGDIDTATDNAAALQMAFDTSFEVEIGSFGNYAIKSPVGLPAERSLYRVRPNRLTGSGAVLVISSSEAVITSKLSLDNPDSTDNLFTGKTFVSGVNVEAHSSSESVFFNGDRLYNLFVSDCSFHGSGLVVVKSFRPKGSFHPDGYLQSVSFTNNSFSSVKKIIEAKRGYNIVFNDNFCESCVAGVYIDGPQDPAVNVIRMNGNLFEGGGVFAKLGKALGYSFCNNYFEANTLGDIPELKCHVTLGTNSSGGVITGNGCQATQSQQNDTAWVDFRQGGDRRSRVVNMPMVSGNWSNSYQLIDAALNSFSNGGQGGARTPAPEAPGEAEISFRRRVQSRNISGNLESGILTILNLDMSPIIGLAVNRSYFSGQLDIQIEHLTSGLALVGFTKLTIDYILARDGIGVPISWRINKAISQFKLGEFLQFENGTVFATSETSGDYFIRSSFTDPELIVEEIDPDGSVAIKLSGYSNASQQNLGPAVTVTASYVNRINHTNRSVPGASSFAPFSW